VKGEIKWSKPRAVQEAEWRELIGILRPMAPRLAICTVFLIAAAWAVFRWRLPAEPFPWLKCALILPVLAAFMLANAWGNMLVGRRHLVSEKGLFNGRAIFPWKLMTGFSVLPHPAVAGQWVLVCHRRKGRSISVALPEGEDAKRIIQFVAERLPIVDAAAAQER
jgi:hypothetical protein